MFSKNEIKTQDCFTYTANPVAMQRLMYQFYGRDVLKSAICQKNMYLNYQQHVSKQQCCEKIAAEVTMLSS